MMLLRDILFFEAREDRDPYIFIAPGVMPHWLAGGGSAGVVDAPTVLGGPFAFRLVHDPAEKRISISITRTPPRTPRYVYPCRLGAVASAESDAGAVTITGRDVLLPPGTTAATITYA